MKNLKMRLAVFLSVLMVLPAVMTILPMAATDVSAASTQLYWYWGSADTYSTIQVEKGQSFYIGDYANVYSSDLYRPLSMFKGSYSSSKKSVATVNQSGLVSAKKRGTSTLTLKYKGQKLTVKLQVVEKGSFKVSGKFADLEKKAASLAKKIPSKITTKNGFSLLKQSRTFRETLGSSSEIDWCGFLMEKVTSSGTNAGGTNAGTSGYTTSTNKLVLPKAGRLILLEAMLYDYALKNSATSTRSAKGMKIRSVSATPDKITIKVKKKLDAANILGARILEDTTDNRKLSGTTTAWIELPITDKNNSSSYYYGKALIKKGSDTVVIIPYQYTSSDLKKARLQKGHTYQLGYDPYYWTKGKTVKVK